HQEYAEAVRTLSRGMERLEGLPGSRDLAAALNERLQLARRAQAAQDLHRLVDRLRFLEGIGPLSSQGRRSPEAGCGAAWGGRGLLVDRSRGELDPEIEQRIQTDLLDLALLWVDLRTRLATPAELSAVRQQALRVLAEAEEIGGSSIVLWRVRQMHTAALGW